MSMAEEIEFNDVDLVCTTPEPEMCYGKLNWKFYARITIDLQWKLIEMH